MKLDTIKIDAATAARNLQIDLHITGMKRLSARIWMAKQIIRMAGWILPGKTTIEIDSPLEKLIARWRALGQLGMTVSICQGPSGPEKKQAWSLDLMGPGGVLDFRRPLEMTSPEHAIETAEQYAKEMGWMKS